MIAAVVLGAGLGRRMGGLPKALLERDGLTYLERAARACREGGCDPVYAVTSPEAPGLEELALALGLRSLPNPDPERGMFSSVVEGLGEALAATPPPEAFLLFPVDHPLVASATVRALVAARDPAGAAWVRPVCAGRGGHPIVVERVCAERLAALDPRLTLREALRAAGGPPGT